MFIVQVSITLTFPVTFELASQDLAVVPLQLAAAGVMVLTAAVFCEARS